ncbi:hypothetical protein SARGENTSHORTY9_6 [Mycobacterium phage SargentShorty9]|nr:hypothetical protein SARGENTSHORTY9_6 [Mycobacterium phage SargentShorty9]
MRRRAWSYDRPPNPLDPGATSRLRRSAVTTAVFVLRNRCKPRLCPNRGCAPAAGL